MRSSFSDQAEIEERIIRPRRHPPENYLLEFTLISEMSSGDPKSTILD